MKNTYAVNMQLSSGNPAKFVWHNEGPDYARTPDYSLEIKENNKSLEGLIKTPEQLTQEIKDKLEDNKNKLQNIVKDISQKLQKVYEENGITMDNEAKKQMEEALSKYEKVILLTINKLNKQESDPDPENLIYFNQMLEGYVSENQDTNNNYLNKGKGANQVNKIITVSDGNSTYSGLVTSTTQTENPTADQQPENIVEDDLTDEQSKLVQIKGNGVPEISDLSPKLVEYREKGKQWLSDLSVDDFAKFGLTKDGGIPDDLYESYGEKGGFVLIKKMQEKIGAQPYDGVLGPITRGRLGRVLLGLSGEGATMESVLKKIKQEEIAKKEKKLAVKPKTSVSNDNTTQSGQGSEVNDTEASPNIIKKVNSFLDDIGVGRGDWEDIKDLTKNDLKKETLGRIFSIGLFDSSKLFHWARSEKSSEFKNDETLEKYIRRISG